MVIRRRPLWGGFLFTKDRSQGGYKVSDRDTIAAISTPSGLGGIGIVRLSGENAFKIADQIFECPKCKKTDYPQPRYLYYGYVKDFEGNMLDEVLISYMPAPKTYTREDVVEINCHSGIITLRTILKLVLKGGARLAEPGEFTKRAFINGRIDLSQAEAVLNMIRARSEEAVKVAARSMQGELNKKIEEIREKVIELRAPLEASFDYPEEFEEGHYDWDKLKNEIEEIKSILERLLQGIDKNRAYQEGVSVAIVGRPNVGKSSLLNALLQQQRAIVHEVPGTTRDLLEGYMNLGGYPIRLIDTAGIQGTMDPVEKQGIELSRSAAEQAKLVIMVVDGSSGWTDDDHAIAGFRRYDQGLVVVINKIDLEQKFDKDELIRNCSDAEIVETAAIKGLGIKQLEEAVTMQLDKCLGGEEENLVIVSLRHEEIISETLSSIENALDSISQHPPELVSLELQNAWSKMGEISGDTISEDLLDKIFSEFCLGK